MPSCGDHHGGCWNTKRRSLLSVCARRLERLAQNGYEIRTLAPPLYCDLQSRRYYSSWMLILAVILVSSPSLAMFRRRFPGRTTSRMQSVENHFDTKMLPSGPRALRRWRRSTKRDFTSGKRLNLRCPTEIPFKEVCRIGIYYGRSGKPHHISRRNCQLSTCLPGKSARLAWNGRQARREIG